jgi:hypothetical protein
MNLLVAKTFSLFVFKWRGSRLKITEVTMLTKFEGTLSKLGENHRAEPEFPQRESSFRTRVPSESGKT